MILLDFSKALDKVPHKCLVLKIQNYGITGMVARLDQGLPVRSHLESCPRRTFKWRRVFSVSQGSILGPCSFWYTSMTYWTLFPPPLLDYLLTIPSYITGSHLQLIPADCRVTSMLSNCGRKHGWWSLSHPNVRFFGSHWSQSQREFLHYTQQDSRHCWHCEILGS